MEVRYCMTRREAWLFNLRMVYRKPALWVIFAVWALGITWSVYWQYPSVQASLYLRSPHIWWLPAVFFGTAGAIVGGILALLWNLVGTHYPDTEPRLISVTALTPECLEDVRRTRKEGRLTLVPMPVPWEDIVSIYWQDGDIYFQRKTGMNIVPRSAFETPRHAQQFLEAAQRYWQSAKNDVPVPADEAAWPPAPRSESESR